jgi:hypothetical protein
LLFLFSFRHFHVQCLLSILQCFHHASRFRQLKGKFLTNTNRGRIKLAPTTNKQRNKRRQEGVCTFVHVLLSGQFHLVHVAFLFVGRQCVFQRFDFFTGVCLVLVLFLQKIKRRTRTNENKRERKVGVSRMSAIATTTTVFIAAVQK